MEILEKISDLLYHNLVEWHWIGKGSEKSEKREIQEADQSKLVSCTDTSSAEEEHLYADVNFDEPIDLAINLFSAL